MNRIKDIVFYLVVSAIVGIICIKLDNSEFVEDLQSNLLTILLTLLAINTATISVIITKLNEISIKTGVSFDKTISEVKYSLKEQIGLIGLTSILLIVTGSNSLTTIVLEYKLVFDTITIFIFIYSINILRDTGLAIFEINRKL